MVTPGPTMISCPDCAGVVRATIAPHCHVEFVCTVGHAFSLKELYIAKEMQVEYAQWSLLALLSHLKMLIDMATESEAQSVPGFRLRDLEQRLKQINQHITLVERLIAETRLPSFTEEGNGEDRASSENL